MQLDARPRTANQALLRRALRFAVSGLAVTGLHVLTAIILVECLLQSPPVANGAAFMLATLVSFVINTVWSFSQPLHGKAFFRFLVVSSLGLALTVLIARVAQGLNLNYLLGIGLVVVVIPPVTFALHHTWTYRTSEA